MNKIKNLIDNLFKNEVFRYLFFGGLSTIVSLGSYALIIYFVTGGLQPTNLQIQGSNVISWVITVTFAYITNKLFVFNSKTKTFKAVAREISAFVSARVFSLFVESGWMWIAFSLMGMNDKLAKLLGQFVVVILNYFFSKIFIFRKK